MSIIGRNELTSVRASIYEQVKGRTVLMPKWQRTYDWTEEQAKSIVEEIIDVAQHAPAKRAENASYLMSAIIYQDDNEQRCVVADGHSRIVTFGIIFNALVDLCNDRGIDIGSPQLFNIHYEFEVARKEYSTYAKNHLCKNNYGKVYAFAYTRLNEFISNSKRAIDVLDAMTNYVDLTFEMCTSLHLAHNLFIQHNTGGVELSNKEIVSSFLQFYMDADHFDVQLEYDYSKLDTLIEGYYFCKCNKKFSAFDKHVLTSFMLNYVVDSRRSMTELGTYFDRIKAYQETPWYRVFKNLDTKTNKVAYVLAGMGKDMSGKDKEVNQLLEALFAFEAIALIRGARTGGPVSNLFTEIKHMVGSGFALATIIEHVKIFASDNYYQFGMDNFTQFSKNMDLLDDKKQHAILWFAYMQANKNSLPCNVNVEHAYPEKHNDVWNKAGWPVSTNDQAAMVNCLGNKLLIDETFNREISTYYISEKAVYYKTFYNSNAAFKYSLNYFDCKRFEEEKQAYLDERRDAYARMLADTVIGKILIRA